MIQKSFKDKKPTLYVVSTPIGNLKDMSYRAVEILKEVDVILCEDTRTSSKLLNYYDIHKPLISFHDFNKEAKQQNAIDILKRGKDIALISDAGTPGINDPGYELILDVIENDFFVVSIPGASAAIAALISSGLLIQPFTFVGFLPRKKGEQKSILETYLNRKETIVIYESPLRVKKTVETLYECFGDRKITLARELTKMFETITRTTLKKAISIEHDIRGEYVLIVEGSNDPVDLSMSIVDHVKQYIEDGYDEKAAMKAVAKVRHITKSEVYKAYKINQ